MTKSKSYRSGSNSSQLTSKMSRSVKFSDKICAAGQTKDIDEEWPEGATKLIIGKWKKSEEKEKRTQDKRWWKRVLSFKRVR